MSVIGQAARPTLPAVPAPRRRRFAPTKNAGRSFLLTFIVVVILAAFLSPILRSVFVSLRTTDQVGALDSPIWPAVHGVFEYQGKTYDVYDVPIDGSVKPLASSRRAANRASSSIRPTPRPASSRGP